MAMQQESTYFEALQTVEVENLFRYVKNDATSLNECEKEHQE
jgi:hypothetical protein